MLKPSSKPRSTGWASGCMWGGLGFVGMALLLFLFLWVLPGLTRRGSTAVALPQMTLLPVVEVESTVEDEQHPVQTGIPQQTQGDSQPSQPKDFLIGQLVQIYGTAGDGLRLRSAPTLGADINLVASEYEVYEVRDGPVDGDGYRWWYLINPYDDLLEGWAVEHFLDHLTED